jgi:Na+-driven multidrug efflux pump
MGCRGAAIATVISEIIQVVILAGAFWRRGNRQAYGTGRNNRFDAKLFSKCLHVGMPMAIGRSAELLAWYLVYVALSHVSKELATIQGITVTIYVLFAFISDGIVKGTAAISANFIGQSNLAAIQKTFKKLVIITLILAFATMLPLLGAPKLIFLLLNTLKDDLSGLHPIMTVIFRLLFVNITLEALSCVVWGILLSGGDTKYQIIVYMTCLWGTVVLPVLILFVTGQLTSVVTVQSLSILSNVATLTLLYRRYKSLKWYKSLTH